MGTEPSSEDTGEKGIPGEQEGTRLTPERTSEGLGVQSQVVRTGHIIQGLKMPEHLVLCK